MTTTLPCDSSNGILPGKQQDLPYDAHNTAQVRYLSLVARHALTKPIQGTTPFAGEFDANATNAALSLVTAAANASSLMFAMTPIVIPPTSPGAPYQVHYVPSPMMHPQQMLSPRYVIPFDLYVRSIQPYIFIATSSLHLLLHLRYCSHSLCSHSCCLLRCPKLAIRL